MKAVGKIELFLLLTSTLFKWNRETLRDPVALGSHEMECHTLVFNNCRLSRSTEQLLTLLLYRNVEVRMRYINTVLVIGKPAKEWLDY